MSIKIMDRVTARQDLKGMTKIILIWMALRADDSGLCYPRQTTERRVASDLGIAERTVRRVIKDLKSLGLLERTGFINGPDGGRIQCYQLILDGEVDSTPAGQRIRRTEDPADRGSGGQRIR